MTRSTRFAGRLFVLLLLASSVALWAGPALASPFTWSGTAGATWDTTAANWTGASGNPWDSVNGLSNEAIISAANATPSVSGTVYLNKITNSKVTTISSGTLTFGGTSPAIVSSDGLTIDSTIANVSLLTVGGNSGSEKDINLGTGLASFSGTVQALNTTNSKVNLSIARGANLPNLDLIIDSGASLKNTAGVSGNTTIGNITVAGVGNANNRGAIRMGAGTLTTTLKLSGSATLGGSGGTLAGSIESLATSGTTYTLTLGGLSGSGSGGPFPINSQMSDGSTGGKLGLLAAAGTVTLSGTNTYTGGTTVSAGSLVGTTSSLQGSITNNAAVTFNQSTSGTYSGVISGSGAFTKLGTGTVTLSGANTYTGLTTVSAGTLLVNGSLGISAVTTGTGGTLGGSGTLGGLVTVQSGGVLSPGNSPGALAAAALDLQAGSTTFMQVIGSGSAAGVAGTNYDQVRITTSGSLSYGGSLDLNFGNSSKFLNGTVFDLFAFSGSPIGHFSSVFSTGTGLYANAGFSRTGGIWTTTIGDQLLSFSELTGRLLFTSSGSAVPEIDPAMGGSALSLIAGVLAMLEQRRRRARLLA